MKQVAVHPPAPPSVTNGMGWFWNAAERRLRVAWRVALQLAIAFGLGVLPVLLIAEPLTAMHKRGEFLAHWGKEPYDRVINLIIGPLLTVGLVASVIIAARWLDRRPLADYGVVVDRAWWRGLALGFAVSTGLMLLIFAGESAAGMVEVTGTMVRNVSEVSLWLAFAFSLVKVLCVGVYEEFIARGYLLRNLGIVVSSLVFALLHLTNDNASAMSTIGLFVNALFFASAALLTRRLSAAIGAHIAWNLVQGTVLGFPVSGDKEGASLIGIRQLGPAAITGGDFGPEAGLAGILASLLGIGVFCLGVRWRSHRSGIRPRAVATPPHS